jgi:hypothetical protein
MPRIETKDPQGKPNGWLLPLWHVDQGPKIDQVYLTTVLPGCQKGPHLHMKRRGLFTCIRGSVLAVWRIDGEYRDVEMQEGSHFEVLPGVPVAFYNRGISMESARKTIRAGLIPVAPSNQEAWLLNMPSPPWRADDQDEHPVEDWTYELEAVSA